MDYQAASDLIFEDLEAGRITRREFYNRYNDLFDKIPEKQRLNLKRRMDFGRGREGRCLGQFALTIYDNTKREKLLVDSWLDYLMRDAMVKQLGIFKCGEYKLAAVHCSGVDNSGKLLIDSRNGKPDYTLEYLAYEPSYENRHTLKPGEFPELKILKKGLEVKFTGHAHLNKLTYKVADIKSYIKNQALVLTIISDGMVGPNGDPDNNSPLVLDASKLKWFIMEPSLMERLLESIPIRDYREMGWKPAIQLLKADFPKYLDIKDWSQV
jgi:hypothetical protein